MSVKINTFACLLACLLFVHCSYAQTCSSASSYDVYNPTPTTYNVVAGSNDPANNVASCGLDGDNAVWITISIPANALATTLTISMSEGWGGCGTFCTTDPTGALYSGSCGSLTAVDDCIDMSGGFFNSNNSPWTYAISPGTDYYFRLSEEDNQTLNAELTFTINNLMLPVEFLSFDGKEAKEYNSLTWTTASEDNNSHFEVERSLDGRHFEVLGKVSGAGTSATEQQYYFDDEQPETLAYYRLRQVDLDGQFTLSETITIQRKEVPEIAVGRVYPNPTAGIATLELTSAEITNVTVTLLDMMGRTVSSEVVGLSKGAYDHLLDLQSFAAGRYTIRITNDHMQEVRTVVKN